MDEKPKRILSDEQKAKMAEGRRRAAEERKANPQPKPEPKPTFIKEGQRKPTFTKEVMTEFLGLTKTDCSVECTVERCAITQGPQCGHPCKGGLQPAYMQDRSAVDRYNRAHKYLAHVELDRRR